MAKHSLTLSCTKHIILHYRLEPQCTRIYKHRGLINKLFTRAPFATRPNDIKSDDVSAQVGSGRRVMGRRYGSSAVHRRAARSYWCFVSSGYVFHHISPLGFSRLPSHSFIGLQLAAFPFVCSPFLTLICPSCQISFSGYRESMVKIVQEEEHSRAFRALRSSPLSFVSWRREGRR